MKYTKKVIVFSDLDGTLLDDNHYFSKKTKNVIKNMYEQGIYLVPITARATNDIMTQAQRLKIDQFGGIIAGNNGSQIYDFKNQKWILNEYLSRKVVEKIFNDNFNKYKAKVHFYSDHETYVFNEGKNSLYWAQILSSDYIVAHKIEEIENPITHLTIVLKKDISSQESEKFINKLKQDFGDTIDIHEYTQRVIELTPPKISKGYAVKKICEYLKVDPKVTKSYGFGDGYNDFALLDAVDVGVAMENGNPQLKDIADDITTHNNQNDGVIDYLLKKVLN